MLFKLQMLIFIAWKTAGLHRTMAITNSHNKGNWHYIYLVVQTRKTRAFVSLASLSRIILEHFLPRTEISNKHQRTCSNSKMVGVFSRSPCIFHSSPPRNGPNMSKAAVWLRWYTHFGPSSKYLQAIEIQLVAWSSSFLQNTTISALHQIGLPYLHRSTNLIFRWR